MFGGIVRKLFGTANDRYIKSLSKDVAAINALEPALEALDDDALRARTAEFRERIEKGASLDELLHEAFATVREAAKRTLGQRHFDVQLIGGMVLHEGKIAEMKTGEGKTLVATLPVYLNALGGKGVHVVTVNDYLARRDAEWMGRIYRFLGMTVGVIVPGMGDTERREAYACDVTYGTNNELGFDYLRDNMKFRLTDMVQRDFCFAIVDEVDSILIDEARTPLIISGPAQDSSELYLAIDELIPKLVDADFEIDEKQRSVVLTEEGTERIEVLLKEHGLLKEGGLYDLANVNLVHHVNQALRAHKLFQKDRDYVVKDGEIVIVDEFTGRMMTGRRYSEGLHQAIEARERVEIKRENQTLASVTFQNYFRLYPKLAGMTGTAQTEATEFGEIYGLQVIEIPTHQPVARADENDEVYRSFDEKVKAIVAEIKQAHERKQPVLVGTVSIEKSEMLSAQLTEAKVAHEVLNARQHEREAYIIAQAGRPGRVTIATNMAGRGTDIQLGGNVEMRLAQEAAQIPDEAARNARIGEIRAEVAGEREEVLKAGGLYVIGTERHESRRIDNQLRGRSGRQGDPGRSKFFLSLQDDLMRIFASDRLEGMLRRLGLKDDEAITHPWINKALEKAQQKVEARNFEIRKQLLRFDNVVNDQRRVIYEQRREIMKAEDVQSMVADMRHEVVEDLVRRHIPPNSYPEQWATGKLAEDVRQTLAIDLPITDWAKEEGIAEPEIEERIRKASDSRMAEKVANYGPDVMRSAEKSLLLQILDQTWKEHLLTLDHLRQGIGLRAYGQRDPLREYQTEAFELFQLLLSDLRFAVIRVLSNVEFRMVNPDELAQRREAMLAEAKAAREEPQAALAGEEPQRATGTYGGGGGMPPRAASPQPITAVRRPPADQPFDPADPATWGKVQRNAPCPCGSGRKYKHCHGMVV